MPKDRHIAKVDYQYNSQIKKKKLLLQPRNWYIELTIGTCSNISEYRDLLPSTATVLITQWASPTKLFIASSNCQRTTSTTNLLPICTNWNTNTNLHCILAQALCQLRRNQEHWAAPQPVFGEGTWLTTAYDECGRYLERAAANRPNTARHGSSSWPMPVEPQGSVHLNRKKLEKKTRLWRRHWGVLEGRK